MLLRTTGHDLSRGLRCVLIFKNQFSGRYTSLQYRTARGRRNWIASFTRLQSFSVGYTFSDTGNASHASKPQGLTSRTKPITVNMLPPAVAPGPRLPVDTVEPHLRLIGARNDGAGLPARCVLDVRCRRSLRLHLSRHPVPK